MQIEEKLLREQLGLLRQDEARLSERVQQDKESLLRCAGAIELCEHLLAKSIELPALNMAQLGTLIGGKVESVDVQK